MVMVILLEIGFMLRIMLRLLIRYFIIEIGDTYNIGGFNEWKNIDLIKSLCCKWISH